MVESQRPGRHSPGDPLGLFHSRVRGEQPDNDTSGRHEDMSHSTSDITSGSAHDHPNQFALLSQRRFAPFFWTQFLGAGNDNLFKFAFTVMVTYQLQLEWLPPSLAGLAIAALFILPFLLFSATAGQATDKYDKTRVIRFVKNLEIAIMAVAALSLIHI